MNYVVVGFGNIGARRKRLLGHRCVATIDPANPAADYRALPDCPAGRYDAAILAVPNDVKVSLLEYLVDHGKHVLVEKPLVFDDEPRARRLLEKAQRRGVVWRTSYNLRFEPHISRLRDLVANGAVGEVYRARLFYGYGTAGEVAGTWRDDRLGVLQDLGSHLVDLTAFLFNRCGSEFLVWERRGHEMAGVDHCILATADRRIVLECTYLSWRNRWTIEVIGARGALHMNGLTKWGGSELIVQRRKLPSGAPDETREVVTVPDPTWAADLAHFEHSVACGQTSFESDLWMSRVLLRAAACALH
jgi:scyllo-inositol 2-dehydrogenase (NADP+)